MCAEVTGRGTIIILPNATCCCWRKQLDLCFDGDQTHQVVIHWSEPVQEMFECRATHVEVVSGSHSGVWTGAGCLWFGSFVKVETVAVRFFGAANQVLGQNKSFIGRTATAMNATGAGFHSWRNFPKCVFRGCLRSSLDLLRQRRKLLWSTSLVLHRSWQTTGRSRFGYHMWCMPVTFWSETRQPGLRFESRS